MKKKSPVRLTKQLSVRVSETMYGRIEAIAFKMEIDPSDVVRIILGEHIDEHELRVKIQPPQTASPVAHT